MEKVMTVGDLSRVQGCSIPPTPPAEHIQEPAGSSHVAPGITPAACACAYLAVKQHAFMGTSPASRNGAWNCSLLEKFHPTA